MRAFLLKLFSVVMFGVFFAGQGTCAHEKGRIDGRDEKIDAFGQRPQGETKNDYKGYLVYNSEEWNGICKAFVKLLQVDYEGKEEDKIRGEDIIKDILKYDKETILLFSQILHANVNKWLSICKEIDEAKRVKIFNRICLISNYCHVIYDPSKAIEKQYFSVINGKFVFKYHWIQFQFPVNKQNPVASWIRLGLEKRNWSFGEKKYVSKSGYKGRVVLNDAEWDKIQSAFVKLLQIDYRLKENASQGEGAIRDILRCNKEMIFLFFHILQANVDKKISICKEIDEADRVEIYNRVFLISEYCYRICVPEKAVKRKYFPMKNGKFIFRYTPPRYQFDINTNNPVAAWICNAMWDWRLVETEELWFFSRQGLLLPRPP
jgi:hypothetical protein